MEFSQGITAEDIKVFLDEAEEQLQLIEEDLVKLEREDSYNDVLQEIFRAAHTLKGSSATLGHQRMASLTHAMENVLDHLRKGNIEVSTHVIDSLFEALDTLRLLKEEIETGEQSDADVDAVTGSLKETLDDALAVSSNVKQLPSETTAVSSSHPEPDQESSKAAGSAKVAEDLAEGSLYSIDITFAEDCPMPSVRAFQVIDQLSPAGRIVQSEPSLQDVEMGKVDYRLKMLYSSVKPMEHIRALIDEISDIVGLKFASVPSDGAAAADPTPVVKADTAESESSRPAPGAASPSKPQRQQAGKSGEDKSKKLSTTVRVDVSRLDALMNLLAELVIDRTRLSQLESDLAAKYTNDEITEELNRTSLHIGRVTAELQEEIMKARMLPVENVFKKFPRMMRDLAQKLEKEIDFIIQGQETELDRSVIEEISDPLIHLLRNAVSHAIELPDEREKLGKSRVGTVKLSAYHEENYIVLSVEDDGKGISDEAIKNAAVRKGIITEEAASRLSHKEAINLIFAAGLSTAEKIDDISGRGVGMDIVRSNLERLNGTISVETTPGRGSKFIVKLPLTLAIIRALLVSVGERAYAIPLASVHETLRRESQDIQTVQLREAILLRGKLVPLIKLRTAFGIPEEDESEDKLFVVIVNAGDKQVGLVVDSLLGEQEIVIKSMGKFIGEVHGLSGVTILGDGRLALIVDVPSLVRRLTVEEIAG